MIDFLSSWVKNIGLALIIVSILEMLLPNNKTKKYLKMVMGMFILFNIISPFIDKSSSFNLDDFNIDTYKNVDSKNNIIDQTSMDTRLSELYVKQLEKDIKNKVEQKGYIADECIVKAEVSSNQENSGIKKIMIKASKNINEKENTVEDKLVTEIGKVQKVEINKKSDESSSSNLTKTDEEIIRNFLIQEYGVDEKCLVIN